MRLIKLTREIVKFVCYDGETFIKEFIVKDDESSKDIIEGFIYQYNKTKMCLDEMCCNTYHILKSEKI